jgi:GTP-binding protein
LGERERVEANGAGEHRTFRPMWRGLRVEKVGEGAYEITGENVEHLALRTDWDSPEGVANFQRELERKGVVAALKRAGAEPGDEVRIGETEFDFQ